MPARANGRTGGWADEQGPQDSERRKHACEGSWRRLSGRVATPTGGARLPAVAAARMREG
jgi:hypothetical protein